MEPILAQVTDPAAKLAEYGVVGVLMLVIVTTMGLLLKYILEQARDDRKKWSEESGRHLLALEKVATTLSSLTATIITLTNKLEILSDKVDG